MYEDGEDKENDGLMIPRYIASGRTSPSGKVYPEVKKKDETNLVPVRSIITKHTGDPNVVTPDLLSTGMKKTGLTPGAAIGASFGTSLTENITQSLLALKHGGHEKKIAMDTVFYAPKACELENDGKWLILKVRGGKMIYPQPENWVGTGKGKFKEGDLIGSAYTTETPAYRLNAIIHVMGAKSTSGTRYFEKENVVVSDCFAYEDGQIHYKEDKAGNIRVYIGNTEYQYNPECLYYFPDGAQVKKFDKICSGTVNMYNVVNDLGNNINDMFNIFRKQFYTLNNADFINTKIVQPDWMQEEIIELVFAGLIKQKIDPNSAKLESVEYQGASKAILSRNSFFTTLSYGYSSRVMAKAMRGELNVKGDIMTDTVLGLLLQDKI